MTLSNGQHMEMAVQGYTGKYVVLSSAISPQGSGAVNALKVHWKQAMMLVSATSESQQTSFIIHSPGDFRRNGMWDVGQD